MCYLLILICLKYTIKNVCTLVWHNIMLLIYIHKCQKHNDILFFYNDANLWAILEIPL